jgi:hypothetical protein
MGDIVFVILPLLGYAAAQLLHLSKGQAQMLSLNSQSLAELQAG